ncbi:DUF3592 domain-containing protein [Duganella sp. S19_KUP01_CR8]|uniref:DUF3592 domain-containing protein n=1 Tax=Duganella sp. S19_KUP01_CR8 TaxID=3025502 RepID=UPI002FCD80DD
MNILHQFAMILIPLAGLLLLGLAYKLAFLCLSRRGTATVTTAALHQNEDSEGYVNRHHLIAIRYEVDGRSYEAGGFKELVDYAVGSEVSIRYRRSNPQDVHLDYWNSLWVLAVFAFLFASAAWFTIN